MPRVGGCWNSESVKIILIQDVASSSQTQCIEKETERGIWQDQNYYTSQHDGSRRIECYISWNFEESYLGDCKKQMKFISSSFLNCLVILPFYEKLK